MDGASGMCAKGLPLRQTDGPRMTLVNMPDVPQGVNGDQTRLNLPRTLVISPISEYHYRARMSNGSWFSQTSRSMKP